MYHIIAHAKPLPDSEHHDKCIGAYVAIFINYKDIDGAFQLAEYYIESNGWEIIEVEEECYLIEKEEDLEEEYVKYYAEIVADGYAMIFNTYDQEEEK